MEHVQELEEENLQFRKQTDVVIPRYQKIIQELQQKQTQSLSKIQHYELCEQEQQLVVQEYKNQITLLVKQSVRQEVAKEDAQTTTNENDVAQIELPQFIPTERVVVSREVQATTEVVS